jgi:O-antigen ligase
MLSLIGLQASHPLLRNRMALLLVGVLGFATMLGLLAANQPLFAIAGVAAVLLMVAILAVPDSATLVVVFVIYSNAAVIAVRFHHVPSLFALFVPMLLMIPLASFLIFRREKLVITPALPLMFLYLLVQVIGTLLADYIDSATSALLSYVMEGLTLYLLVTNVVRTPKMLRWVVWTLLLTGAFLGLLSLIQQVTHTYNNNYAGFAQMSNAAFDAGGDTVNGVYQKRLAGPLGDQNYYAQFMLMIVPIGFFRFWSEPRVLLRILAVICTLLCVAGVLLTFSRGGAVGFVLMLGIVTVMGYIKPYQIVLLMLALLLMVTALPQFATRLNSLDRLSSVTNQDTGGIAEADSSIQSRMSEMLTAGLVFIDHPVVGVGPGTFKYYYPEYSLLVGLRTFHTTARAAHDLYIAMAAETGSLGLACFLAIIFVTLRQLARLRKQCVASHPEFANMATGYLLAILSYMATGLFLSFAYERYFWMMLALAGATACVIETMLAADARSSAQATQQGGHAASQLPVSQ